MSIIVSQVSGPVFIKDEKGTQAATVGMSITNPGEKTIIATGEGGRATLSVEGHLVQIRPKTWMKLKPRESRQFDFIPTSKDVRIGIGKAWAYIFVHMGGNFEGEFNEGNAVVGVRG